MKDARTSAVTAVLGLLAVGFAAATLPSTTGSGAAGGGRSGGQGGGSLVQVTPMSPLRQISVGPLDEVVVAGVVVLVVYLAGYRRDVLKSVAVITVVLAVMVAAHILLFFDDPAGVEAPSPPDPFGRSGTPAGAGAADGGGGGSGGSASSPTSTLPLPLVVGVGVALVGVALTVWRVRSGGDAGGEDASPPEDGGGTAAAVGRAAGRAADRLERTSAVDNEVFRAWREMTALLDVDDPETSTPGEFADAAVEAGLGTDDVRELTRLFEDVRYGDATPDGYERRSVDILRRIEERYAETGDGEDGS